MHYSCFMVIVVIIFGFWVEIFKSAIIRIFLIFIYLTIINNCRFISLLSLIVEQCFHPALQWGRPNGVPDYLFSDGGHRAAFGRTLFLFFWPRSLSGCSWWCNLSSTCRAVAQKSLSVDLLSLTNPEARIRLDSGRKKRE